MFHSARLKLTGWYLLIIMLVSSAFSVVIYQMLMRELDRFARVQRIRIERPFGDLRIIEPAPDPDLLNEAHQRLIVFLVAINGGVFILAGGAAYFLAGRTLRPIQNMVDEQNRFISDASHELRTPLTSLKTGLEVFLREKRPSTKDAQQLARDGLAEVNSMQSLSDSLLQLAQYQKPNGQANFEVIYLNKVVQEAINRVKPVADQKQIIIQNLATDIAIKASKFGVTDIIVILLDNAIKYSPEKSEILVKTQRNDGVVNITVSDQGQGIAKDDLPKIFDRFYRADMARTKTDASGYGLGLSIAKRITDIHRGTITVESELGKGSTFTVKLPIG